MVRRFFPARIALAALTAAVPAAAGPVVQDAPALRPGLWMATVSGTTTSMTMSDVAAAINAKSVGADGTGVGIALVDTGVAPVTGLSSSHVVNGPDLSFESQAPSLRYLDTYGHGTHMAGILVGDDSSAGLRGLAPGARLFSVKTGTSSGSVDVSQMLAAIDWVVQHRNDDPNYPIRVLNLSYGTPGYQTTVLDPLNFALENAWRHGIVVVVAGGNGGAYQGRLTDPAYDPYVISVGSLAQGSPLTSPGTKLSAFTQTSPLRNIDLAAPGEGIVSLRDPASAIDTAFPGARVGTDLFRGSGTSQATAVVSGAVALLLQKRPGLTPDQVKALLKSTATPVPSGSLGTPGVGALNLGAAVAKATPASATQSATPSAGSGSLEYVRGGISVYHNGIPLGGEFDLFGPFNAAVWAQTDGTLGAWRGGVWNGVQWAGDGWTGISWASRTWGAATWPVTSWDGSGPWTDPSWSGHYWTGDSWDGHYWTGHYWSGNDWTTASWA